MGLIKNYAALGSTVSRKVVLNIIESGLASIQKNVVLENSIKIEDDTLLIKDNKYFLKDYNRVILVAFGKGSASIAKYLESTLGSKLTSGYVIDVTGESYEKCEFTLGTHPLPSYENLEFTKKVTQNLKDLNEQDLVLVVICGGGSVLFDLPNNIDLTKLTEVNQALLNSGLDIIKMNTVRKHLSKTKGGGLAKILYPARVVSLVFSDVPGNDLSWVASGPTVKDDSTRQEALEFYHNNNLASTGLKEEDFIETPKEEQVFEKVDNILMLSNRTALEAMRQEAENWGIHAEIFTDHFQSNAQEAGRILIEKTKDNTLLLAGGETTVEVRNQSGKGGRNQHLVLSSLKELGDHTVIASVASDGWDNSPAAGAIGDYESLQKAQQLKLDPQNYIDSNDSFLFFNNIEDAIITNRLPSNVSDLILIYKNNKKND